MQATNIILFLPKIFYQNTTHDQNYSIFLFQNYSDGGWGHLAGFTNPDSLRRDTASNEAQDYLVPTASMVLYQGRCWEDLELAEYIVSIGPKSKHGALPRKMVRGFRTDIIHCLETLHGMCY